MISGDGVKIDIDCLYNTSLPQSGIIGSQVVLFDPKNKKINKKNKGVRLIAWISNLSESEPLSEIEVLLKTRALKSLIHKICK